MYRRAFLQRLFMVGAMPLLPASRVTFASDTSLVNNTSSPAEGPIERLAIGPEGWRGLVSKEAWQVLFRDGTERPWSSPLNDEKRDGTYICAACYLPLFLAEHKYDSGTGWPSFTQPIEGRLGTRRDFKLIIPRTEYHCLRCGGHHGHVFNDGPPPRGERWCSNGVALHFIPADDALPALRGA
jgi:peptide-methionine (R)-S-oxide reductase